MRQDRARPDEADVAFQDVDELWEFIERSITEELTEPGDARIVFDFAVFGIFVGEILASHIDEFQAGVFFAIFAAHAAEFDQVDWFTELTEAFTDIKYWSRAGNQLQTDKDKEKWRQYDEEDERNDDIKDLFGNCSPANEWRLADGDHRVA